MKVEQNVRAQKEKKRGKKNIEIYFVVMFWHLKNPIDYLFFLCFFFL